jgi:excisionase family DNA binding protein
MEMSRNIITQEPYTVKQLCKVLGIGRNKAYELIAKNQIKHVRIGPLIKIPRHYVDEFIIQNTV